MGFIVSLPVLFQRLFPHLAFFVSTSLFYSFPAFVTVINDITFKNFMFFLSLLNAVPWFPAPLFSHLFCVFSASVATSLFVFLPCFLHITLSSWENSRTSPEGWQPHTSPCFQLIIPLNLKHPLYLLGDVEERRWAARHCGNVPLTCGGCCVGWSVQGRVAD